ncbi:amidohydrolase [Streptomyces phaeochromogenes]|uniref:amidohydrolase n=1 Tax=Streptomyces phaeochromogenes TaxID=1923 RepID=UPI0035943176
MLTGPDAPQLANQAIPALSQLDHWITAHSAKLIAIRRHLHAHPELSHHEFETAALIVRELSAAGLKPELLPKGNGVLWDIGTGDRVIAFRADLDALPLPDTEDVPYRSTVDNVTHACGHDVHTTVLLGLGPAPAELDREGALPGRIRLIFQPAEEGTPKSGAPEVIAAGGLTDVASIFALHCDPRLDTGLVGVRAGSFTAAVDIVEVTVTGPGGHTARPHLTADLVHALGRVIVEVPALLDRRLDPRARLSMVWAAVHAGDAPNVLPGVGHLRGTVRALDRDAWQQAPRMLTRFIHDAMMSTGAKAEVQYIRMVPPVINDLPAAAVVAGAARAALGADHVVEAEISMGGEDFAFYLEHVPGAMIRLGAGTPGSDVRHDLHQSDFNVDERCIGHGVRVLTHTAIAALTTETSE